jgi:putative pantetheine hydrolase
VPLGIVGAGTGATAGHLKGGVGSASAVLSDGSTVAALVVVNPAGSVVDPATGELYAARFGLDGEFGGLGVPDPDDLRTALDVGAALPGASPAHPVLATTIGVIATDITLTKAQCAKVSGIGHDGMARAIRPVHTMFDGDTLFTLSTCARPSPDQAAFFTLLEAAGDCVTRAIGHAVLAAQTVESGGRTWRSYRDAFPTAFAP